MKSLILLLVILKCLFATAQYQDKIDFVRGDIAIEPITNEKRIEGTVTYEFKVLQDVDSVFLDAHDMDFSLVRLNDREVAFSNSGNRISISKNFKKGKMHKLKLVYSCTPKQTVYFLGWNVDGINKQKTPLTNTQESPAKQIVANHKQVWTQGQGKYSSHWLPSFDDMQEKVEFDLNIRFDAQYEVIANGELTSDTTN
ncbi:MAG TPA: hypothetical protein ENH60_09935, partial [Pricia sp.]|nr:hypothetical protein [Pricia sp.]